MGRKKNQVKELCYLDPTIFRPQTKHEKVRVWFHLINGGIGDYINHMSAFKWLAEKNPHIIGHIVAPSQFFEIAQFIMKPYTHWQVVERSIFNRFARKMLIPGDEILDPSTFKKYIGAPGAHLLDLGFMLYAQLDKPPEGFNFMVDLSHYQPSHHEFEELDLHMPYAVFTPGYTAESRVFKAEYMNKLLEYTKSKGITPVFLGKKDFANRGKEAFNKGYFARFQDDIDYSLGVDLREKTSLLDAIYIMGRAKFVIGIDNGLLNLAGTTKVPIIFGHTITQVRHRDIRRREGKTINIIVDEVTLPCSGCQSKMRYIMKHKFSKCIYGDYQCLDLLFANDCEAWKKAIDSVL
jgi:ADP-heptose:LPS heptosyltransferase